MITQNTIRDLQFICEKCNRIINFVSFCNHYDFINYLKTVDIGIKPKLSSILIDDDFTVYFKSDSENKIQMSFEKLNYMKINDLINYLNKQKNIL